MLSPGTTRWDCPQCLSRLELKMAGYLVLSLLAMTPLFILGALESFLSPPAWLAAALLLICLVGWAWLIRTFAPMQLSGKT